MDKLVVALVAVHALTGTDLRNLLLADPRLTDGILRVRRSRGPHAVFLYELTYRLADDWLAERHRRWPETS